MTTTDYQALAFEHVRSPDQDAATPVRRLVVIVGAGPVGLSLAIDLAQRQVPVVLLDNDHLLSTGSRAICFAKRTLEIFDRLGVGQRMVDKGVSWQVGRVFFKDEPIYQFDLQPESGHERPAFINLQQYYVEGFLVERAAELPLIDLRWQHRVAGVVPRADHVELTVETPDGPYTLQAGWLAACDGSRSTVRQLMGLETKGRTFKDRFLIADVRMKHHPRLAPAQGGSAQAVPAERWFWFDPPFHPGQSVLLHMQPDNVWRIDFQLGWEADPEVEKRPENILPRVRALLGPQAEFELEWASVYTFSCLRMERFRHGRVVFAGDSAHGVSPFGARGANSGVQDAENLAWKLAAVLRHGAPDALLDTYADERQDAADENLLNSTRATDFITPKSEVSRLFRDAVLALARQHPFARSLVNSGRLSVPATLHRSALNTSCPEEFAGRMLPGAPAADTPLHRPGGQPTWLLRELGEGFTALVADDPGLASALADLRGLPMPLKVLRVPAGLADPQGLLQQRYDLRPGTVYLFRPDQHVCARWRQVDAAGVAAAVRHAMALPAAA